MRRFRIISPLRTRGRVSRDREWDVAHEVGRRAAWKDAKAHGTRWFPSAGYGNPNNGNRSDPIQLVGSDNKTTICFPTASAYRSSVASVGLASSLFSNRESAARSIPVRS